MDDDISVDLPRIIEKARALPSWTVGGWVHQQLMVRRSRSKWSVTMQEYSQKFYPDFVSGWVYAAAMHTIKALVKSAKTSEPFWIDDVWLTGIVREKHNDQKIQSWPGGSQKINLQSWSSQYTPYVEHLQCCLNESNYTCDFIAGPSGNDAKKIIGFGALARRCFHSNTCSKRPSPINIWKNCQVKNPFFLPESSGVGKVLNIT